MNSIIHADSRPLSRNTLRHTHDSWEFAYCVNGAGALRLDGGSLACKKGDVLVIPPDTAHSFSGDKSCRCLYVNMLRPTLPLNEPALIHDESSHFLLDAFSAAKFHFSSESPERSAFLTIYGSLIACYLTAYQTLNRRPPVVEEVEKHILAHFADPGYELDGYLKSLPFNYDYLRKLFKKEMRVTPHQYLNDKRLQAAADALMIMGGKAGGVADIARMCGFREPLYFSRMFKKKYGVAPSFYQSAARDGQVTAKGV